MATKEQLIIALDFSKGDDAIALVDAIGDAANYYKVGLELFLNSKGSVIEQLKARDKHVFLDLKFHDIPNTVAALVAGRLVSVWICSMCTPAAVWK